MNHKIQKARDIVFRIKRYNPENSGKPYRQEFSVHAKPGMTVLEGLREIKENLEPSLSMRFSCRMGVCGSCAMLINGLPSLSCNVQLLEVADTVIELSPLPNFYTIKDLVPDLTPLFEKHAAVKPYILRKAAREMEFPSREYSQTPEELVAFLQFANCIKCGACMSACPTQATDRQYLGPMAFAQAHRYNQDTRDDGFKERKKIIGDNHGIYNCHCAGECSRVCSKGVDPGLAIQHLKRNLFINSFKMLTRKKDQQQSTHTKAV